MKKIMFITVLVPFMAFQGCNSKEKPAKEAAPVVDNSIVSASFSPDGKKILVAHKNYVLIYDTASGAVLKKIPEKTKKETAVEEFFRLDSEGKL